MKIQSDHTYYSKDIRGDSRNYGWKVSFDVTDGYLGINQMDDAGAVKDRVLLSPQQMRDLVDFYEKHTG